MKNVVHTSRSGTSIRRWACETNNIHLRSAHSWKHRTQLCGLPSLQSLLGNNSPLSFSHGCWGSSTQVSTFSPVSGSTSVWKVRRGWDWFSDIHRAFSGNMVSEIGKCVSLMRKVEDERGVTGLHLCLYVLTIFCIRLNSDHK